MTIQHPLFIAGEWLAESGRAVQSVINPATGQACAQLSLASKEDLDQAIGAAAGAFQSWRNVPAPERASILRRAAGLIRTRIEELAAVLSQEQGKVLAEAKMEIGGAAEVIDWMADQGRRAYGRIVPARMPGWRTMVRKEPVGVVALFTPWNAPALCFAAKVASALAAGCTCIIKPAEEAPGIALGMARALHDAGLPAGVLNVVFGVPHEVSEHLIQSPVVRKVSFTGSVGVGRAIAALAAQNAKPATLELGGHAPALVFDDVDVVRVAKMAVASKFFNAGQICTSPTRFLVQRNVYEKFAEALGALARDINVGPGTEPGSMMGPLINERRVNAIASLVDDAKACGATVLAGGSRVDRDGFFFAPTVLGDVPLFARAMHEEPFGPLALITPFDDEEEALSIANDIPFGLAAYAFTANADRQLRLEDRLQAGIIRINSFAAAAPELPFGGVKDSGYGLEGGDEGLDAWLTTKSVALAPSI
ncbi:TPA: NAD-dependent succinate-semialdehyde dehydrogenase [Pseudomonas putida]|nr:NAD-dependent succinate-semialdehyde dehydrogenase [Pseudomonas putida]